MSDRDDYFPEIHQVAQLLRSLVVSRPFETERMAAKIPALYPMRDRSQRVPKADGTTPK